jgi:hypothetical protein
MTRRRNIVLLASALCLTLGFSRTASAQFCNNNTCGGTTEIGYSGTGYALQVATTDGIAIWAETLAGSVGIYGTGAGDGIEGVGQGGSGAGVWGVNSSGAIGVLGGAPNGAGVVGYLGSSGTYTLPSGSFGVFGDGGSSGFGLYGTSGASGADGVAGVNTSTGNGVYGTCASGSKTSTGAAVYANNTNGGWAIYSNGPVNVNNSSYWYDWGGANQTCVGGLCASDERLKQNIKPISGALDELLQLKGVTYEWKKPEEQGNQTGTQTGFIAQQVEKSFPNWVSQDKDGTKGIVLPPMQLAAMTVESIRQLNDRANKAEARADKAEAKNQDLEERIDRLENMQGLGHRIAWWQNPGFFGLAFGGVVIGGAIFMGVRRRRDDENTA